MCGTLKHDAHALARHPLARQRPLTLRPELLGLEPAEQLPVRDAVEERCEPVVELRLVGSVIGDRHAAVLAGRDDVERRSRVVADGERRSRGEKAAARDDQRDDDALHRLLLR
jgi:hypothetical protein